MNLKVYNNLERAKVDFKTIEPGKVKFYSCGPTTYDFLHIGNARALVVGDLFHRVLKSLGYQVTFVRNYTDVDDKIIDRAHELKVDPLVHAARFVDECKKDMDSLGMMPATHTPKVSETMPEIIKMIEDIIKNGAGYVVDGEVFFHVEKADHYGKLSKKDLEGLQHGQRVEVDKKKKHPADFVLWKPAKAGEPAWDSPWGKGRPGWHIECSAMAKKFLGTTLDLHHGGVDLMFPHHENEIAQSEAANSCQFCTHWAHNEFLNFGSEKMSKSLGNVIKIRDFNNKYSGAVLRMALLSVHYRTRLAWSEELIENAISTTKMLHEVYKRLVEQQKNPKRDDELANDQSEINTFIQTVKSDCLAAKESFKYAISQDFNSAAAITFMYQVAKDARINLDFLNNLPLDAIEIYLTTLHEMNDALGVIFINSYDQVLEQLKKLEQDTSSLTVDAAEIEKLIEERKVAKASKNWARADEIRNILKNKKITLMDHPDGSITWKIDS